MTVCAILTGGVLGKAITVYISTSNQTASGNTILSKSAEALFNVGLIRKKWAPILKSKISVELTFSRAFPGLLNS